MATGERHRAAKEIYETHIRRIDTGWWQESFCLWNYEWCENIYNVSSKEINFWQINHNSQSWHEY